MSWISELSYTTGRMATTTPGDDDALEPRSKASNDEPEYLRETEQSGSLHREAVTAEEVQTGESAKEGGVSIFRISLEELRRRLPDNQLAPPEYSVSTRVLETFERFCEIHEKGRRLNDDIHRNKRISNPYFVANTLQHYEIDQADSYIHSAKRRRMMENMEIDSLHAFREFKKQRRQGTSDPTGKEEGRQKELVSEGGNTAVSQMTAMQQEVISQFVLDAKKRLHGAEKKSRFQ